MAKQHHYVYGSGQPGCMYDYGPHHSPTLRDALDDLSDTFRDLPKSALRRMRGDLRRTGVHYFPNTPCRDPHGFRDNGGNMTTIRELAGAGMAEVTRFEGPCPEDTES